MKTKPIYGVVVFLNNRWIIAPLDAIRRKAQQISSDSGRLGEQLYMPRGREMAVPWGPSPLLIGVNREAKNLTEPSTNAL
ncbi:MAG TPA: hypothetical protein ENN79_09970 [Desulfobacteraceae bacterium]|nr:hypothetical protein [Desulfobacteraceae bacterium]